MRFLLIFVSIVLFTNVNALAFAQSSYKVPENRQQKPTETTAAAIRRAGPEMPDMPPRKRTGGYCCMLYDVTEKGKPDNIRAETCTNEIFSRNAIRSIKKWRFNPANINGEPVRAVDQKTIVSFVHVGWDGKVISDDKALSATDGKSFSMLKKECP